MQNNKDQIIIKELVRRSNDELRRVRELENRFRLMEDKATSIESMLLEKMKKIDSKFVEMEADIKNISEDLVKIKSNLETINRHMNRFAMKRDLREIERMFDLLSPSKRAQEQEIITG
jgi:K+/H+ antiporter YhaU regulatory subunit KhtT